MEKYIIFTSGRGPVECSIAVNGIQNEFIKYLKNNNVKYEIIKKIKGRLKNSINTIVIKCSINSTIDLTPWIGTIKWVCSSPVRKNHKRKNWFIKSDVITISKSESIIISEVEIQSYRASGPGGQHRNKVETAIRLVHKPSGIIVTAADGKSQHQNKKKAWERLNEVVKNRNLDLIKNDNFEQWESQLSVERGNAVKTFIGMRFKENTM